MHPCRAPRRSQNLHFGMQHLIGGLFRGTMLYLPQAIDMCPLAPPKIKKKNRANSLNGKMLGYITQKEWYEEMLFFKMLLLFVMYKILGLSFILMCRIFNCSVSRSRVPMFVAATCGLGKPTYKSHNSYVQTLRVHSSRRHMLK